MNPFFIINPFRFFKHFLGQPVIYARIIRITAYIRITKIVFCVIRRRNRGTLKKALWFAFIDITVVIFLIMTISTMQQQDIVIFDTSHRLRHCPRFANDRKHQQ